MADHPATPPSLLPANRRIVLSGEDALRILREIEFLLQSLHHIGRHYYPDGDDDGADALRRAQYCAETTRFIDAQQATTRFCSSGSSGLCSRLTAKIWFGRSAGSFVPSGPWIS